MEASRSPESLIAFDLSVSTDSELCKAGARGSQRAFDELHLRHHRAVSAFVFHTLGDGHRREDAEDVVQDAFARAFAKLEIGGFEGSFRAWLFTIARNRAIDLLRTERVRLVPIDGGEPASAACARGADTDLREEFTWLVSAIGQLPERQRAALLLSELGGMSHEAIAAELGASTGSVRQLIGRARENLRREAVRTGHASGSGRDFRRGLLESAVPAVSAAGLGTSALAGAGAGAAAGLAKLAATVIAAVVVAGAAVGVEQKIGAAGATETPAAQQGATGAKVGAQPAELQPAEQKPRRHERSVKAEDRSRAEVEAGTSVNSGPAGPRPSAAQTNQNTSDAQPPPSADEQARGSTLDPVTELPGKLVGDVGGALSGSQDLGQTVGGVVGALGETTSGLLGGR